MNKQKSIPFPEFVTLMALYVALMAMSIDMILPALSLIGQEFKIFDENQTQYIISTLFLGFTFGQLIYGPISDSYGRKFTIYIGLILLIIGDILCLISNNFELMLIGRFMQGFGAASPRITSMAVIRDCYKGKEMARVMSFIMTVFIIIPVIAPSVGQAILFVHSWRVMFEIFLAAGLIAAIWTYFRLPETLKKKDIKPFNIKTISKDLRIVIKNKTTMIYTICAGLVFGALIGYLTSSRQIFQEYFGTGKLFSLYFGLGALSIGISSIVNSMIVRRSGMKLICQRALIVMILVSLLFIIVSILEDSQIPLWQFMIFVFIIFFCVGLLFGNLNALAMEPMGHLAGIASTVIGCVSSAISVVIGTLIGQFYNGTPIPLISSYLLLTSVAFILQRQVKS